MTDFTHREAEKPVVGGYTPGPWMAFHDECEEAWKIRNQVGCIVTDCGMSDMTLNVDAANARLISAAPELLEAAQGLLAAYKALADAYGNEAFRGALTHPASWAAKTESAIAKALGQQAAVSPDTQPGTTRSGVNSQ